LNNFPRKNKNIQALCTAANVTKNYTNFTSLCKSEKVDDILFFSKILLTRGFPQVKFSASPSKSLDFALKSDTFTQLPQSFPQHVGKIRKKADRFLSDIQSAQKRLWKRLGRVGFF